MKKPLSIVMMVLFMGVVWGALPPMSPAQSDETPKLIKKDLDPLLSENRVDEEPLDLAKGKLTGVVEDMIYVDKSPYRITEDTTMISKDGFKTSSIDYEDDMTAVVRYKLDEATGGEDIPIALFIRVYAEDPL